MIAGKHKDVTVSVSTLVPKPHTPFQWAAQITEGETIRKQQYLAKELRKLRVNFRYHNAFSSFLEGVFARGDRQLGKVILNAYQKGCRLDGWSEELSSELWLEAFEEVGIDPHHYLHEREVTAPLPWDHLSCDIPKRYFLKEWKRAIKDRTTPDCLTQSCSVCGACDYDGYRNVLFDRERTEMRLGITSPPWQKIIDKRDSGQTTGLLDDIKPVAKTVKKERTGSYKLKEYLQTETDTGATIATREALPIVERVRVRYQKTNVARFFAHLELASVFFRAARRAGIPIAFSQGFNPKPKFSFGPPLQLGISSEWELVDIFLTEEIVLEELIKRFNNELPKGLKVIAAEKVAIKEKSIQASISKQSYQAFLSEDSGIKLNGVDHNWQLKTVDRIRKRSRTKVSVGDSVEALSKKENGISFTILQGQNIPTLKPMEVVQAVTEVDAALFEMKKIGLKTQPL